jgi:hypothetical protein
MSPEQLLTDIGAVDFRSDIFSFGIMLYEFAGGRHPFQGKTPIATMAKILESDPPPLAGLGRDHAVLDNLIQKCLQKNPEQRYQSTRQLVDELHLLGESGAKREAPVVSKRQHAEENDGEIRLQSYWWVVHQTLVVVFYAVMIVVLWEVQDEDRSFWSMLSYFATLACAIANSVLRIHLLFTSRFNRSAILDQITRLFGWLRRVDGVFTVGVLAAAAASFQDRLTAAVLASVAVGYAVIFLVVEPATVHSVFALPSRDRGRS